MTWYVVKSASDGTKARILKDDYKAALDDVREFQQAGFEAWVEDVNGKVVHSEK